MTHGMGRRAVVAALVAATLAGATVPGVPPVTSAAFADEIDDTVADLAKIVADGDEARAVTKITLLEKTAEKRVDAALLNVVKSQGMDGASRAAMRVLGIHRDPAYLNWARSKVMDEKMIENRADQYCAMLDSLPAAGLALKPMLPTLASAIKEYMPKRPDVTSRAITAYAAVHDKATVVGLIALLEETEGNTSGGGGGRGGLTTPPPHYNNGGGGGNDKAGNLQKAKDQIIASLKALTGGEGSDRLAWKYWWAQNEKTFRFPSPEPVWATLEVFTDDWLGLVLKKPAGDDEKIWAFEKCEFTGGRARLKYKDASGVQACIEVMSYERGSIASAEEFAKTTDETWRRNEFADYTEGGEPVVTKKKIGGREFAIVAAKGTGAGSFKDWDACERRTYVTIGAPDTVLTLEAVVRAGFPDDKKAAFWAALDGVTFAKVK